MKQSFFIRLIALFCAVVVSSVLLEGVAELGHPATSGSVAVATVVPDAAPNAAAVAAVPASTGKQL